MDSWELSLRAEQKAAGTVRTYIAGVRLYLKWCEQTGAPAELTKSTAQRWLVHLGEGGAESATVYARYKSLKHFARWLVDEDELGTNPLEGLKPPKVTVKVTSPLGEDDMLALLATCRSKSFVDRRDDAILRLLFETGLRANEAIALALNDVDLKRGILAVHKGKGGKGRIVPFSPQVGASIDRYLRLRRSHRLADTPALWLGGGGKTFGYHGLDGALKRRAQVVGLEQLSVQRLHTHLFRHSAASRWLSKGGSEQGAMSTFGWSNRQMLDRYTAATTSERAIAEAKRLDLGKL
jgi:site-specific recombinase XerD